MSEPHAAVEAVRAKALAAWRPGLKYAFASDPATFQRGKKPAVLLAIVTRTQSLVMAIDQADWLDPVEPVVEMLLSFIGCETPSAMELATEAKKEIKAKR